MTEKDLAAELQATKDDLDEWGDAEASEPAPTSGTPKRRLAAMVSVRLSPEELESVQSRAAERGESVSGYLRGLVLRDITPSTLPFQWPVFISSSEPFMTETASSPIVRDGGRVPTRAS